MIIPIQEKVPDPTGKASWVPCPLSLSGADAAEPYLPPTPDVSRRRQGKRQRGWKILYLIANGFGTAPFQEDLLDAAGTCNPKTLRPL